MIDLDKIQIYVPAGTGSANRILSKWLSAMPINWDYGPLSAYDLVRTRNRIIRHFLKVDAPRGKEYLLMIDANAVPVIATNEIISTEGDLIYCGMVGREGKSIHYGDGDFGVKCFRASADLLKRMTDPWFESPPDSADAVKPCECGSFQSQAMAVGVESKMTGVVGHVQDTVIFPDPESKHGYRVGWPSSVA